jgi:S1-C subfamily serine protease
MLKGGLKKIASYPRLVILAVITAFIVLWAVSSVGPLEKLPTQSFFRLTKTIKIEICEGKKKKKKKSNICIESEFRMTASAFVVDIDDDGAYLMTAAHVCDSTDDLKNIRIDPLQKIFQKPKISLVSEEYRGSDIRGAEHVLKIVAATKPEEDDICILYGDSIKGEPLTMAPVMPDNGEKVYNMSAPTGYSFKNMVPIFEGRYSGINPEGWAIYTIPVIGGSSGSPILNRDGQVVGMIVMRLSRFHHVSLSPQRATMESFLKKAVRSHQDPKCLCTQPGGN